MANDFDRVRATVENLAEAGLRAAVFGGWADELHGLSAPRPHHDIDLIVLDPEIAELDAFVHAHDEVVAKRQSHKRAFIAADVLVELFIVTTVDGRPRTTFWGSYSYEWPDLGPVEIDGLPVVTIAALAAYRRDHAAISAHRP